MIPMYLIDYLSSITPSLKNFAPSIIGIFSARVKGKREKLHNKAAPVFEPGRLYFNHVQYGNRGYFIRIILFVAVNSLAVIL